MKAMRCFSLVAFLLVSGGGFSSDKAFLYVFGEKTDVATQIEASLGGVLTPAKFTDQDIGEEKDVYNKKDFVYINLSSNISLSEKMSAKKAFLNAVPVLFDASQVFDTEKSFDIIQDITGVGLSAPVVIASIREGEPHFSVIDIDADEVDQTEDMGNMSPGRRYEMMKENPNSSFMDEVRSAAQEAYPDDSPSTFTDFEIGDVKIESEDTEVGDYDVSDLTTEELK